MTASQDRLTTLGLQVAREIDREIERRYQVGVRWIAANDDPTETRLGDVQAQISVKLLADVFGHSDETVARAVIRQRRALRNHECPSMGICAVCGSAGY